MGLGPRVCVTCFSYTKRDENGYDRCKCSSQQHLRWLLCMSYEECLLWDKVWGDNLSENHPDRKTNENKSVAKSAGKG